MTAPNPGLDNPFELIHTIQFLLYWAFILAVGRLWLIAWRLNGWGRRTLLLPIIGIQIAAALLFNNDYALIRGWNTDHGALLPYGVVWWILDPLFMTERPYLVYLLLWQLAFMAFMLLALKMRPEQVYWAQVVSLVFTLAHNPQSIVPLTFLYMTPAIGPLGPALWAAIKLPLGWSFPPTDTHWLCAFGPSGFGYTTQWLDSPCGHFASSTSWIVAHPSLVYGYALYIVVAAQCYSGMAYWIRAHRSYVFRLLKWAGLINPMIKFLRRTGFYERRVLKLLERLSGDTFVDVGSNWGYYSRKLAPNFRHVYPLDPNPKYPALHVALSDRDGEAEMYIHSGTGSADTLIKEFRFGSELYLPKESRPKTIRVETRRFDTMFKSADLVKIDVEGAEFLVLEGMGVIRPRILMVELHDFSREDELVSRLELMGYIVEKVDHIHFFAIIAEPERGF